MNSYERALDLLSALLPHLKAADYHLALIADNEGPITTPHPSTEEALKAATAVDLCTLIFEHRGDPEAAWILFIAENGSEAVCDHSTKPESFMEAMDAFFAAPRPQHLAPSAQSEAPQPQTIHVVMFSPPSLNGEIPVAAYPDEASARRQMESFIAQAREDFRHDHYYLDTCEYYPNGDQP